MKLRTTRRTVAALLALVMILLALPTGIRRAQAAEVTYTLDATDDLTSFAQGDKADGDNEDVGTDGYFTVFYSAKTKVDGSSKTFEDGYAASQRLNFGGKSSFGDPMKNVVKFATSAPAAVKIWWVSGGDGREMAIWDASGNVAAATDAAASVKNSLYIDTLTLDTSGTYYLALPTGSNYLFKLQVTETSGGAVEKPERAAWESVTAPVITSAADNGNGDVIVTVSALVGYDGADEVTVVAVHGMFPDTAPKFITEEYPDSPIVFLSDFIPEKENATELDRTGYYTMLGGVNNAYPRTVIVDENGVITHVFPGAVTHEELENAVKEALGK